MFVFFNAFVFSYLFVFCIFVRLVSCELIWNAGEARAVHYLRWLRDSSDSDPRRDLALSHTNAFWATRGMPHSLLLGAKVPHSKVPHKSATQQSTSRGMPHSLLPAAKVAATCYDLYLGPLRMGEEAERKKIPNNEQFEVKRRRTLSLQRGELL